MNLEARAARAARSLHGSVALVGAPAIDDAARRRRFALVTGFAGALAVAIFSVAMAAALPNLFPSDEVASPADSTPTTIGLPTTTLPGGGGSGAPVVIPTEDHSEEGEKDGVSQANEMTDDSEAFTTFYGTADPGTVILASSEYGSGETVVNGTGEWVLKVWFDSPPPGTEFPVVLTVGDEQFDFSFTSWWDPEQVEVTAHQKFGHSDDPEPFEKFFGTAPPGTIVIATSEYGAADAVADEHGEWKLRLHFDAPLPFDEPIDIMVLVGDDDFPFSFVSLFDHESTTTTSTTTTTKPVQNHDFTAVQHNNLSDDPTPYSKFYGTAPAGTHIVLLSEYGAAEMTTEHSGEWLLKVWFNDAPTNQTFPITLKVNGDVWRTYDFKWVFDHANVEITVHQYNEASDDPEPYAKFHGTAPPGTHIVLLSEYGNAEMVTEGVEWWLKIWLEPLPPAGEPFPITVKVNGEVWDTYSFTSWWDPANVNVTVTQHNTASESPEPWVKFYGTAPAGTQIKIQSPYGNKTITTEGTEWLAKLHFSTLPPAGEPFTVKVKVNGDVWDTYTFTSWYDPEGVDKTAHATYGECSETEPYDVYYGTAPAGTEITISSEYGGASTVANGDGQWSKKVFFTGAPPNVEFLVTVNVGGEVFTFGFVATNSG